MKLGIQKFLAKRFLAKEIGKDLLAFVMSESIYEQQNLRGDPPVVSGGKCGRCHRKNGVFRMDVIAAQLIQHHVCLKGYPPSYLCPSCLDEWLRTCGFVCPRCHRAMKKSFVGWAVKEKTLAPSLIAQAAVLPNRFDQTLKVVPALREYLLSHGRNELAQGNAGSDILCPNCVHDLLCAAHDGLSDKFLKIGYKSLEMESIPSRFEETVEKVLKGIGVFGDLARALNTYWGYEASTEKLTRRKRTEESVEDFVTNHSEEIVRVWDWLSERSGYGKSC